MSKKNKIILGIILVTFLLIGVGYAALSATTLNIKGSAGATANPDNFKIVFSGEKTENIGGNTATATVTANTTTATVAFAGMQNVGDTRTVILEIVNNSTGTTAAKSVAVTTTSGTDENFEITAIRCNADGTQEVAENAELAKGAKTYVKITAKLLVAPDLNDVSTDAIDITLTATPQDQTV